jgi:hypothetical protein
MPSAKQIKQQKAFAKKYAKKGKKKTGGKSKKKSAKAIIGTSVGFSPTSRKSLRRRMTKQERFPEDNWFKEYKRLGGKKNRKAYDKNLDVFVYHTNDIFIHGDMSKYKSRQEALEAVKKDLKIDNKELNLIFVCFFH